MTILQTNPKDLTPSNFPTPLLSVLHLVGSSVSDFYFKLSLLYAKEVIQPQGVISYYALVHPDGNWQLGHSLDNLSDKIPLEKAIEKLPQIDVVVPHMFCFPGMTTYRAFFEDILNIPVVGSPSNCNALITNKAYTKSIVSSHGVIVPQGQQIQKGDTVKMKPPFIIKPNSEDNSMGLTLVWKESEIESAKMNGFKYDNTLLVEEYIPGREFRVGVIEKDGELLVLPPMEYLFTKDNPIRTDRDKLNTQSDGTLGRTPVNIVCPPNINQELFISLANAAKKAHIVLGSRDYSLYDFRVHSQTQQPYLLESCSFWSFTEASVLSKMVIAQNLNLEDIAFKLWTKASQRTRISCGSLFKYV